jgi:hypothetical protein
MPVAYLYRINTPAENPPVPLPTQRNLTHTEISDFANQAHTNYNQTSGSGLSSLMDEAKLLVIHDQR